MLYLSGYSANAFQNAGSTKIKTERSGYYEFTFKTTKQNSIIGYGNSDLFQSLMPEGVTADLNASADILAKEPVVITSDYAYIQEENVTNKTFSINLKNGKINLKYKDNFINHEDDFEITGNLNVADNNWHHVVVNIGRPGTLRERGLKFNKKFIEIWIDGELDFRTTDYINNKNIFFPILEWMLMNPLLAISYDGVIENGWNTGDRYPRTIFEDFEYVIYTNKDTYQKYNLNNYFNKPNIEIKFVELNSEYYLNKIEPIRQKVFNSQEIYDRIYTVKNYLEVILNKLQFMLNETNDNKNVIWIDSGLFGTSCHDRWRDYMVKITHTKTFLIKLNECVDKYNFICIRGNQININYELKQDILELFDVDLKIIPGGIFGGKSEYIKQIIGNYKEVFNTFLECKNKLDVS
jgi:hypothetical protein